jgi:SAM-dependent methyltransferase
VRDSSFDIVACNNAFHLVQDALVALREFRRVLQPNGLLVLIDWCLDYPQVVLMDLVLRVADGQARNIRTENAMVALMSEAGFEVTHRERFRVPPMWGLMALTSRKR